MERLPLLTYRTPVSRGEDMAEYGNLEDHLGRITDGLKIGYPYRNVESSNLERNGNDLSKCRSLMDSSSFWYQTISMNGETTQNVKCSSWYRPSNNEMASQAVSHACEMLTPRSSNISMETINNQQSDYYSSRKDRCSRCKNIKDCLMSSCIALTKGPPTKL